MSSLSIAQHGQPGADPAFAAAIRTMLPPHEAEAVMRGFYTDALHRSVIEQLAALRAAAPAPAARRQVAPLPKWRLARVRAFIDAHLSETLDMPALAEAAGLSQYHFARQFRAATSLSPARYVLRRRIEVAKEMLARTDQPIVHIALEVGFQTQSHFTTSFRLAEGLPPHRWRCLWRDGAVRHPVPAAGVALS